MTERWTKALNIILTALLILVGAAYVYQGTEFMALRGTHEATLETLHNQTNLIVELRQELVGLHYRNFESEQELRSWVNSWVLTKMPIVLEAFGTTLELRGQKYSMYQDCDDFAEAMQRDALRNGFLMDRALVNSEGCIYGVKVSNFSNHNGNTAIADNAYWFVEPQTGQIVRITSRD